MRPHLVLLAGAALAVLAAASAHAQAGGAYNLEWNTLGGGGQTFATGGAYVLGSTVGQADAGTLTGGAYALQGGFWNGAAAPTTGIDPSHAPVPLEFAVRVTSANPFRGAIDVQFDLPDARRVSVALFGVDGRLVRQIVDGDRHAGRHTAHWDGAASDGRQVPPGMYFARIQAGTSTTTLRIVRVQ